MKRYTCGAGDGMFEDKKGYYVSFEEHQKALKQAYDSGYNEGAIDGLNKALNPNF